MDLLGTVYYNTVRCAVQDRTGLWTVCYITVDILYGAGGVWSVA